MIETIETIIAVGTLAALLAIIVVVCDVAFAVLDERRAKPVVLVRE